MLEAENTPQHLYRDKNRPLNYTQYNNTLKITSEMQYNLTSLQVFKGVRTESTWFVNPVSRLQLLYPL